MGSTLIELERYAEAQDALQTSLEICQEISARSTTAQVLLRLAELYQKLGHSNQALEYCDLALAVAVELRIPLTKECQELKAQLRTLNS